MPLEILLTEEGAQVRDIRSVRLVETAAALEAIGRMASSPPFFLSSPPDKPGPFVIGLAPLSLVLGWQWPPKRRAIHSRPIHAADRENLELTVNLPWLQLWLCYGYRGGKWQFAPGSEPMFLSASLEPVKGPTSVVGHPPLPNVFPQSQKLCAGNSFNSPTVPVPTEPDRCPAWAFDRLWESVWTDELLPPIPSAAFKNIPPGCIRGQNAWDNFVGWSMADATWKLSALDDMQEAASFYRHRIVPVLGDTEEA